MVLPVRVFAEDGGNSIAKHAKHAKVEGRTTSQEDDLCLPKKHATNDVREHPTHNPCDWLTDPLTTLATDSQPSWALH